MKKGFSIWYIKQASHFVRLNRDGIKFIGIAVIFAVGIPYLVAELLVRYTNDDRSFFVVIPLCLLMSSIVIAYDNYDPKKEKTKEGKK